MAVSLIVLWCLQKPVILSQVPDYNLYVTKEDEMCFEVIERRLKEAMYSSASEFLTDIDRIVSNAVAYNSPYCGDQGHQSAPHPETCSTQHCFHAKLDCTDHWLCTACLQHANRYYVCTIQSSAGVSPARHEPACHMRM